MTTLLMPFRSYGQSLTQIVKKVARTNRVRGRKKASPFTDCSNDMHAHPKEKPN